MGRSPAGQRLYLLSLVLAVAPFGFGLWRAVSARGDLRMLWMAVAAFLGATVVTSLGKARGRTHRTILVLGAMALVVAVFLAEVVARLLGATRGPGGWMVALALGLMCAASRALGALSR
jgi:hypothetical protein